MSNIRIDVDYTIKDGTEIKFRSPVDCSAITGLIVYYPGADGNTVSKVFTLADAHGNNVGDIDHLFAEDVVVKVILDVTKGMAFVQNADTNAYLEGKFRAVTMFASDPNNDGNIVLSYGGDVVPGGGGSGGSGGTPGADGFSPIATVVPTEDGALITITDKNGTTEVAVSNGKDGAKGDPGATGKDGAEGKSAYQYAKDGGFEGTEEEFAEKMASSSGYPAPCVMDYGAKGDGSTDDTVAFQTALAENRVVFVPGGTYKLSGTLVIRENCCLELSQDTVLKFTQTDKDGIQMRGSATLRGNHALITVPYEFTAHVIDIDTLDDGTNHASIPPYALSSPMFRRQRFVYDVNIIKAIDFYGSPGVCQSKDGGCNGTAIYMSATKDGDASTTDISFMWAVTMSGIRIAGAFNYGIHAINYDSPADTPGHFEDDAWNHDMRIEAVIEGCEIGVALENCNGAHLNVTIEPNKAQNGTLYAKHGIYLSDSRFVDLMRSRVWDWNTNGTLWTSGGQYQHLALMGNCKGLLLDDFLVHEHSADIRDLIYTDNTGNFDTMSVFQEPASKWFKSVDNKPYFFNGDTDKEIFLKEDFDSCFVVGKTPTFTDVLAKATDTDGSIYNGIGYSRSGGCINGSGVVNSAQTVYGHTGFIAVKDGSTVRVEGMKLTADGDTRIVMYDADFNLLNAHNSGNIIPGSSYWFPNYVETENGFSFQILAGYTKCAYIRLSVLTRDIATTPLIAINEEIGYTMEGYLADGIKVKGENVVGGGSGGGVSSWNDLTDKPFGESDNAVLLPPTQFAYDSAFGLFAVPGYIDFMVGKTYTVNWNGVDYTTEAVPGQFNGESLVMLGNPAALGGANNNLPFAVACLMGSIGAIPLDGSTAVNVGITGYLLTKIPVQYLPRMQYDICINETDIDQSTGQHEMTYDTTELVDVLLAGGSVYLQVKGAGYLVQRLSLSLATVYWAGVDLPTFEETLSAWVEQKGKAKAPLLLLFAAAHGGGFTLALNAKD